MNTESQERIRKNYYIASANLDITPIEKAFNFLQKVKSEVNKDKYESVEIKLDRNSLVLYGYRTETDEEYSHRIDLLKQDPKYMEKSKEEREALLCMCHQS